MEFGASIFFTDYSISPTELAVALEERGFEALWAAEHSHIPAARRTPAPGGGELAKRYYDVMDPFVTLAAAAAATKRLKVGTGVCLVIQRDTIQTAKQVASICSRIRLKRVAKTVPWSSISSAFQPPPMPNRNRPPDIWSIEATCLAVWIVSRWITRHKIGRAHV